MTDLDRTYEAQLSELLKESAEDSGPGDTEKSTVGVNPDPAADPEGRETSNIDAPWGEPGPEDPQQYSNGMLSEFVRGREGFLKKNFDGMLPSQQADKKLLEQNLSHAKGGDFDASSAMSSMCSKHQPPVADTLLDRAKKVLEL